MKACGSYDVAQSTLYFIPRMDISWIVFVSRERYDLNELHQHQLADVSVHVHKASCDISTLCLTCSHLYLRVCSVLMSSNFVSLHRSAKV